MSIWKKTLTPVALFAMMLSPTMLIEKANANDRGPEWHREYRGHVTFKLTDDKEMAAHVAKVTSLHNIMSASKKSLAAKEKTLKDAKASQASLQTEINKLTTAIADALEAQNKLKNSIPGLQAQVPALQTAVTLSQTAASSTQAQFNKAKKKHDAKKLACDAAPTAACQAEVATLAGAMATKKALNDAGQADLKVKKAALKKQNKKITDTQAKIAKIDSENAARATKLTAEKVKLKAAKTKVAAATNAVKPAKKKFAADKAGHDLAKTQSDSYRRKLVTRIIRINEMGERFGLSEGADDGIYLSGYYGIGNGQRDGDNDGRISGIRIGEASADRAGREQGIAEGSARAEEQGRIFGTREGNSQGNMDAGQREGAASGRLAAEQSDAGQVGTGEGRVAGQQRAESEGNRIGTAKGKSEAINKFESRNLDTGSSNGNFAGAFAPMIPNYPGFNCVSYRGRRYSNDDYGWRIGNDYNVDREMCPKFYPRHTKLRLVRSKMLKKAFRDGYIFAYRRARRAEYVRTIDSRYMNAYNENFRASEVDFSNRDYPQVRENARVAADTSAFNDLFPQRRSFYFGEARTAADQNPDRSTTEFTSAFGQTRSSVYTAEYERIRLAAFGVQEQNTFDAQIEGQVEKFRAARFQAVSNIYKNNSVLKFVGSEIKDAGIKGNDGTKVASNDGVYQPGESTVHNVTVKNFGDKAASNVSIVMDNGQKVKLPTIPAKSQITVKGAAQGRISSNSSINSNVTSTLRVYSPLSAEASIQGRHYANPSQGLVNSGDRKVKKVQYPLSLSGLTSGSQLLINQNNKLRMQVSNNSQRNYQGPLEIALSVNSASTVIKKGFNTINSLSKSVTIDDAQVSVSDMRDVYKSLSFTSSVSKNGVKLGELSRNFNTMVKAPFKNEAGKAVVLVDSDNNASSLLDLLDRVGGLENVNVLDLSLRSLNAQAINKGLDKMQVIAVNDNRNILSASINELLKKSSDASIVIIDNNANGQRGLDDLLRRSSMKDAQKLNVKLKGFANAMDIVFNNKHRGATEGQNAVMQSSLSAFKDLNTISKLLTLNGDEFVGKIKSEINRNSFFSQNLMLQVFLAKALAEVHNVNTAYKETDDKKYVKAMVEGNLLYKKLLASVPKKVNEDSLPQTLAEIATSDLLLSELGGGLFNNKARKELSKAFKTPNKNVKKYLKKFDKKLYSKAYEAESTHNPLAKK